MLWLQIKKYNKHKPHTGRLEAILHVGLVCHSDTNDWYDTNYWDTKKEGQHSDLFLATSWVAGLW